MNVACPSAAGTSNRSHIQTRQEDGGRHAQNHSCRTPSKVIYESFAESCFHHALLLWPSFHAADAAVVAHSAGTATCNHIDQYCGWLRNPFRTTWKPWLKLFVVWYLQGIHQKPGLLRWCEMDFATIHITATFSGVSAAPGP